MIPEEHLNIKTPEPKKIQTERDQFLRWYNGRIQQRSYAPAALSDQELYELTKKAELEVMEAKRRAKDDREAREALSIAQKMLFTIQMELMSREKR